MIGWRDPSMCATMGHMNALDQARATIAGANAKRVATDPNGRVLVSAISTHLLAQRAVTPWWNL